MPANYNTLTLNPTSVSSAAVIGQTIDTKATDWLAFQLGGTWAGTVVAEGSFDGGVTWAPVPMFDPTNTYTAGATANGIYLVHTLAFIVRLRCSSYTSGTVQLIGGTTDVYNAR